MPKILLTATRSYKQVCAKHLLTPPQNPHPSTTWPPCHCSFCAFSSSLNCALPRPLHTAASAATSLPCPHFGVPPPQCRNEKQLPSQGFIAMDLQPRQLAFHSLTPDWKAPDKHQQVWSYDPLPSIRSYLHIPASPEFTSTLLCFKCHLVTWLDLTRSHCNPVIIQCKDYVSV